MLAATRKEVKKKLLLFIVLSDFNGFSAAKVIYFCEYDKCFRKKLLFQEPISINFRTIVH
jgi:hypothetical protein